MLATIVPMFGPVGGVLVALLAALILALVLIRQGQTLAVQRVSQKVWRVLFYYVLALLLAVVIFALVGWIGAPDIVRPGV